MFSFIIPNIKIQVIKVGGVLHEYLLGKGLRILFNMYGETPTLERKLQKTSNNTFLCTGTHSSYYVDILFGRTRDISFGSYLNICQ